MDDKLVVSLKDLPFRATIKYLGSAPAKGLWGMKHTRKPVDYLVNKAKNLPHNQILPIVKAEINVQGMSFREVTSGKDKESQEIICFAIDTISYGVQDLVYTRVFSIIEVKDTDLKDGIPFFCHSFVCDSKNQARQITYALAAAFQEYGRQSRLDEDGGKQKKRFAIDLRTPEEQKDEESEEETEA